MIAGLVLGMAFVFMFFILLAAVDLWLSKHDCIRVTPIGCAWVVAWLIVSMTVGHHSNLKLLIY